MKFLFVAAGVGLFAACDKSDQVGNDLPGSNLKSAHGGTVITVLPNGSDDTENLLDAFAQAAASGPGTTIQLVEGDYYAGYIAVYDFHGSLVGAGRDKTIFHLIPGIDAQFIWDKNQYDAWWRMIGGDITITDMTFKTPDGILIDDVLINPLMIGKDLFTLFVFANYNDEYYHPEESQRVVVKRVDFYVGYDNPEDGGVWKTDHNALIGIWMGADFLWPLDGVDYPLVSGDFSIEDCYFEHILDGAEGSGLGVDAVMKINSCVTEKCYMPFFFTCNFNSSIFITNNIFLNTDGSADILIDDNDWGLLFSSNVELIKRCEYCISGNILNTGPGISSILSFDYLVDLGSVKRLPMLLTIKDNVFNLEEGSIGISLNNSQDAVISNNRFTGECMAGIYVDGVSMSYPPGEIPFAKNVLALGNNFSRLSSSASNVYLGEHSMDCTVVGSKTDGNVADLGVNNKITGMNQGKPGVKIGPTIRDNFRLVRGMGH